MTGKMTHKEHMARAMLMNMLYDWRDGTYCTRHELFNVPSPIGMLDCCTLQPITGSKSEERIIKGANWDVPTQETPWARMDDDGTDQETD